MSTFYERAGGVAGITAEDVRTFYSVPAKVLDKDLDSWVFAKQAEMNADDLIKKGVSPEEANKQAQQVKRMAMKNASKLVKDFEAKDKEKF